jgi:hypothetical protein
MKCETIGTVSFNDIAIDKIAVEIRMSLGDTKFIFIFILFFFSVLELTLVPLILLEGLGEKGVFISKCDEKC